MITRYKLKKRRNFRTKNHLFKKAWVFQYSLNILDFDQARELLNLLNTKINAWQVTGNLKDEFLKFSFRSSMKAQDIYSLLPENFHKTLHQDF